MSTETMFSSAVKRRVVFTSLVFIGAAVALALSGCVFAAVRTARFIERKVNPPQPALHGTGLFFDGSVKVALWLRSTEGRRRAGAARAENEPEDSSQSETPAGSAKPRMTLMAIVTNLSSSTVEVSILSVDSLLGTMLPVPQNAALAAGQRLVLDPFRSTHESNLDALTVTVTLKHGGAMEKQEIALAAFSQKPAGETK